MCGEKLMTNGCRFEDEVVEGHSMSKLRWGSLLCLGYWRYLFLQWTHIHWLWQHFLGLQCMGFCVDTVVSAELCEETSTTTGHIWWNECMSWNCPEMGRRGQLPEWLPGPTRGQERQSLKRENNKEWKPHKIL